MPPALSVLPHYLVDGTAALNYSGKAANPVTFRAEVRIQQHWERNEKSRLSSGRGIKPCGEAVNCSPQGGEGRHGRQGAAWVS